MGEQSFRVVQKDYEDLRPPRAVLVGYRGSIAHGMYSPQSEPNSIDDKDVMAVIVAPADCYLGLAEYGSGGTREIKRDEWDIVVYELRKFIHLLYKGNPNVMSLLWLDQTGYLERSEVAMQLIAARGLFATRSVYHSFVGYAYGQLHRMTHAKCEGYMGEKRKKLVERFGHDTKNAAHLIRLLRMGIEFLNEGEMHVRREDAAQLLEIKRGEWTLEQVKAEAEHLFKRAEEAYDRSTLPAKPDWTEVNELCIRLVRQALGFGENER